MTREKALEILTISNEKTHDKELKDAIKVAIQSIESMEKMREDTDRLFRAVSQKIFLLRQGLRKEISEQEKIPSWSYVRGLKFASGLVEEHLTRIEGLRSEENEDTGLKQEQA